MPPKKVAIPKKAAEQPAQIEPVKQQQPVANEPEKEEVKATVIEAEPEKVQIVAPEIEIQQVHENTHLNERKLSESEVSTGKSKQGKILVLADKNNNKNSAQSSTVISLNKVNIPAIPKVEEDFEAKKKLREVRFGTNATGEATTEETQRV